MTLRLALRPGVARTRRNAPSAVGVVVVTPQSGVCPHTFSARNQATQRMPVLEPQERRLLPQRLPNEWIEAQQHHVSVAAGLRLIESRHQWLHERSTEQNARGRAALAQQKASGAIYRVQHTICATLKAFSPGTWRAIRFRASMSIGLAIGYPNAISCLGPTGSEDVDSLGHNRHLQADGTHSGARA